MGWAFFSVVSHDFFDEIEQNTLSEQGGARPSVSVLTYNTHRMNMYRKVSHNQLIHYLRRQDADIVCLQEVEVYKNPKYLTLTELRLAMNKYAYTYYDFKVYNKKRQFGNVVFSKYPLINKETVRYSSRSNISSRCDVVVGSDTLRLIVNHLESNRFTREDFQLPDSINSESLREGAKHISEKLESARTVRHGQADALHKAINESPYPVLVVGDFNAIPLSYTYWRIRLSHALGDKFYRPLRDAFLSTSRWKLGNTYVRRGLGIRIDYILCSPSLQPKTCRIDEVNYSDHYPMTATLQW